MSGTRTWVAGAVLVSVVLVGGGVALGVQPALASAQAADMAASSTDVQAQQVQARLAALSRTAAGSAALQAKETTLERAVPSTLDADAFVSRVNALATQDGVHVVGVKPDAGQPYAVAAAAPGTGAPAGTSTTTGTTAAPVPVVTDPRITGKTLTVVPMAVTASGTQDALLAFAHDLQHDRRLFLVSALSLSEDSGGGAAPVGVDDASSDPAVESDGTAMTATLSGSVYVLHR